MDTQRVTDAYTENCVVHIKIAILAIVIFAIAGRKTLYSSNATGYELQICSEDVDKSINVKSSVISKIFLTTYSYHLFVWTVTYFLENDCIGIYVVLCCIVFLESLSYVFVESAVKYVDTSLHVMTPGLHITLLYTVSPCIQCDTHVHV